MTKKYLCGVVSAAVLMGACPTAVFAADLENPLDFRSMTEDAADTDAGWAWDASSQTLTVENLSLTVPQGKLEESMSWSSRAAAVLLAAHFVLPVPEK